MVLNELETVNVWALFVITQVLVCSSILQCSFTVIFRAIINKHP